MALKDILNKIAAQVSGDNADAIKTLANEAISEANTMQRALSDANEESRERKEKLKQAQSDLETKQAEIETLKKANPDVEALKAKAAKYDEVVKAAETEKRTAWQKKAEIFAIKDTEKLHGKVQAIKDKFRHAPEGKELSIEDIEYNMSIYDALDSAKYFEADSNANTGLPRSDNGNPAQGFQNSGDAVMATMKK